MKVAVFGPSGMLGRCVVDQLQAHGHMPQPIYRRMVELLDKSSVERSIEACDAVINCAGQIPQRNQDIVGMVQVNSEFPHVLVSCGVPTILVSTDCVFSGRANRKYTVDSLPDPRDYYGRSKSLGEAIGPNSCIVRTSFIGCEHGFMGWLISNGTISRVTGATQQVPGYKNALWTGSTVVEVAKGLVELLDNIPYGIVHLSTDRVINKYDLALKIIELKGLDLEVVPSYQPVLNRALEPTHRLPDIDEALAAYKCSRAIA
jgi:dTDP-4-dehydrorhamnose reductase